MDTNSLNDLIANSLQWIQAGQRVLENHADMLATQSFGIVVGLCVIDQFSIKENLAGGYSTRWVNQSDDCRSRH